MASSDSSSESLLSMIEDLARDFSFSVATISNLIELLLLFNNNLHFKDQKNNMKVLLLDLLNKFKRPQLYYSLRINLSISSVVPELEDTKSSKQSVSVYDRKHQSKLTAVFKEDEYIFPFYDGRSLPNILFLKVKGPIELDPPEEQEVHLTVDRFAAESALTGANIYIPGFNKIYYNFKKNQSCAIFSPSNIHVANGLTMVNSGDIIKLQKGLGIKNLQSKYSIPNYRDTEAYSSGIFSDHSLSPLLGCWALMNSYEPGMTILDVCSAPGHKTCALSEIGYFISGKFPKIHSIDRSSIRLKRLEQDMHRLHLENIEIVNKKIQKLKNTRSDLIGKADLAILDPPCSALGTRPKMFNEFNWMDLRSFFLLQRSFVKEIDQFIKPGGKLLYNTCTITPLEDESVVWYIMDRLGYRLVSIFDELDDVHKKFANNISLKDTIYYGDLHQGFARNEDFINYLEEINDKSSRNVFENTNDLRKYFNLTKSEAAKVFRTFFGKYSNGYFMALLEKK